MYTNRMFQHTDSVFTVPEIPPYAKLIRKLAEKFVVRDVMVHLPQIEYVAPGDEFRANRIVEEKRYSVVPAPKDGEIFEKRILHRARGKERSKNYRRTADLDFRLHSGMTPLTAAFFLFRDREWYFTLRKITKYLD